LTLSSRFFPTFDSVTLDTDVTDGTLRDVGDVLAACNIRNIDASLLREMKVAAAREGLTLRDWAIRAFVQALESPGVGAGRSSAGVGAKRRVEKAPVRTQSETMSSSEAKQEAPDVPASTVIPDAKCFCGASVFMARTNQGVNKWKCEKGHWSTPRT
jgi:hypothetical protein